MRWSLPLFAILVASFVLAQTQPTNDEWAYDEATLRSMNLPTKGPALLDILRARTPQADNVEKFKNLAKRLDATNFPERTKAMADLVKMGPVIRPLLEQLMADGRLELETKRRVQQILETMPPEKDISAAIAASRLIDRDKPADRLAVLMDFVPHATNESVRQEVQRAINGAALEDKKPAPLIVAALKGDDVAKRAAAAEALVRTLGPAAVKDEIAVILKNAQPLERYQIGLALVEKHAKSGLPLLIQAVADGNPDRAENALDLLYRAAGETAPDEPYLGKKNAEKFNAAWTKWYETNLATIDLSTLLTRTEYGYTILAVTSTKAPLKGKIIELSPKPQSKVRWEFEGPRNATSLQVVGPNRLLIAEYYEHRITERDFKGTILKQFPAQYPIGCQRLTSGNTLIVMRQRLQIVDGAGVEVFSWSPPLMNSSIIAAERQRNGDLVVVSNNGLVQLLDAKGKELKKFNSGNNVGILGVNIEMLPNGRVLMPLYQQQMIAEFDWTGAKVWSAQCAFPLSATRLANGNTLVTSSRIPYRVVELDKTGQEVWSYQPEGRAIRAVRR